MKKSLLLVLLAMFAILQISCSEAKLDEAKLEFLGNLGSDSMDIVKCVVENENGESKSCYDISRTACIDKIGARIINEGEMCINFTCKWDATEIKYGERAALSFAFQDSIKAQEEGCSFKGISPLEPGEYIISSSTIAGLSYDIDTIITAKATVICEDKETLQQTPLQQNCRSLTVKKVPLEFTCSWTDKEITYGGKSTLNFAFDPASVKIADMEHCTPKISPLGPGEHIISSSTIPGLSYTTDTPIYTKATVTCGNNVIAKDCDTLKVKSVQGPIMEGGLSFKRSDHLIDSANYFFINTRVDTSFIRSTVKITNKEDAQCGDVKIKIEGSPAKLNTPIKATAVVTCNFTGELELASISAEVLPDPIIGNCELTGKSKTTMRSNDTLTIGISVDNDYKRCTKIEYTFNGTTFSSSSSFALANSGGTDLKSIKAKVTCSGKDTTVTCPAVSVASYIKYEQCSEANRDDRTKITFKKGKTIVDFACAESKDDYYISCNGDRGNFSIEIDGYKEGEGGGDIRPNGGDNGYNFPNLNATKDGNLYRYPISVTVNNKSTGDIKCGIW